MTQKYILYTLISGAVLAMMVAMSYSAFRTEASVAETNEYMATTTGASVGSGNTITASKLIKSGYGSLGSVVVLGAATGRMLFYDATTTDVTLRTGNVATSTILLAALPASLAAGTYTFDVTYTRGLYVQIEGSGIAATTTITYR